MIAEDIFVVLGANNMNYQINFTDIEYENRKRHTRREEFLKSMDELIPWQDWVNIILPYYPSNKRGRRPISIETMLRMYLMQNWFGLSDEGVEDAIYDSYAMKAFLGINFMCEQVPDATTLLKFRHLLEKNNIASKIFDDINNRLDASGLIMHGGTIVDATIIHAPSSTKNKNKSRDPEMHQTKKGNQWHFGMKIHSGVDAGTGYVHTITATPANTHDIVETHKLIRKDDRTVYADSGYLGIDKREEIQNDNHLSQVDYRIVARPSQNRLTNKYSGFNWDIKIEHDKSSVRCKVEHPFRIVKNIFRCAKTRYRGLQKNLHMFYILFGSANLLMCIGANRQEDFCLSMG